MHEIFLVPNFYFIVFLLFLCFFFYYYSFGRPKTRWNLPFKNTFDIKSSHLIELNANKHRSTENAHCNGHVDDQTTKEEEVYQDLCAIQRASRPQVSHFFFHNLFHFF